MRATFPVWFHRATLISWRGWMHLTCPVSEFCWIFFFLLFLTTGVPVSSKFLGTHCTLCCDNSFLEIVFLVLGYNIIISLASFSFNWRNGNSFCNRYQLGAHPYPIVPGQALGLHGSHARPVADGSGSLSRETWNSVCYDPHLERTASLTQTPALQHANVVIDG